MSSKSYIRKAIKKFVSDNSVLYIDYSNWYVGITNDIGRRKAQHQGKLGRDLKKFKPWEADSANAAAALEKEFLGLGMKGAGGGWTHNSYHIYVYKKSGPGA